MSADASGSEVVLRGPASSALSGRVSADGTTLVNYTFAEDVEILDVANQTETLRIYPSRLAGVNLTNGKVRYYTLNSAGEISRMILDDVTGDMQQYGVLTSVNNLSYTDPSSNLGVMSGTYVYDIAGTSMTYHSDSVLFSVERGPCRVVLQNGQVHRIYNLTSVKLSAIDGGNAVTQSGTSYPPVGLRGRLHLCGQPVFLLRFELCHGRRLHPDRLVRQGALQRRLCARYHRGSQLKQAEYQSHNHRLSRWLD